jgi:hypothetical protein
VDDDRFTLEPLHRIGRADEYTGQIRQTKVETPVTAPMATR